MGLHDGQNHSFSNVNNSDEGNFSKEPMGTDAMSSFLSLAAEKKQLFHERRNMVVNSHHEKLDKKSLNSS